MFSLDMMVVAVCQVDFLHATVGVHATSPHCNGFILYQTLVVESEFARLVCP